jgi:hypothetical protein
MVSLDGDDDVTAVADKILQAFKRYDHCGLRCTSRADDHCEAPRMIVVSS